MNLVSDAWIERAIRHHEDRLDEFHQVKEIAEYHRDAMAALQELARRREHDSAAPEAINAEMLEALKTARKTIGDAIASAEGRK